jgi:hypothetical protein
MPDILDDQTVPYAARRRSRAKHVRLKVRVKAGLVVVILNLYNVEEPLTLTRIMGYLTMPIPLVVVF